MVSCWGVKNGIRHAEVKMHQGSIKSLAVNTEDVIASTGDDGAIRLWNLPDLSPCAALNTLRPPRPYEAMNISRASGLTSAQKEALVALGALTIPSS